MNFQTAASLAALNNAKSDENRGDPMGDQW